MNNTPRAIIIGLDGATFELLEPLMISGHLPNLAAIRNQASWGVLTSTNPPTTPPAWTTCTTGVNPGRHGIFDFSVSPLKNPSRPLISSKDVMTPRLWGFVEQSGGRSIVVNVPITYPPEKLEGCMISGMMTPGYNSPFTHPADLKDRIKAVCGNYIPNVDIPRYDTATETDCLRFFEALSESLERRFEAVRYLMDSEEWTFFMVVFVMLDRIQHLFAKYLFPGSDLFDSERARRLRPHMMNLIRRLDDLTGALIEKLTPEDTLFILSDHGFGTTEAFFNANTWLIDHGLLSVNRGPYRRKRIFHMMQHIGDHPVIRKTLPSGLQSWIRGNIRSKRSSFTSPKSDLASVVDWRSTRVFFSSIPCQGFYVNVKTPDNPGGNVEPEDVRTITDFLKEKLMTLRHPVSGKPVTDEVWFREDLYQGTETHYAPHVMFRMKNYSILGRQHLGASGWFTDLSDQPVGFHRSDGILIVKGPGIHPGRITAEMADITPNVLYSMGIPIPQDLDGKVIPEVFTEEFRSAHPIRYAIQSDGDRQPPAEPLSAESDDDDRAALENRLRNLGYLE